MGNVICFQQNSSSRNNVIKLIFWEGTTRVLKGKHIAGEIMFEFPDKMVCHADSFFIGHPIPSLGIDDELMVGQTYFVLPLDLFSCNSVLSASSLSALGSQSGSPNNNNNNRSPIRFGDQCPFEYLKGSNGKVLIKVMPEFITKLITRSAGEEISTVGSASSPNSNYSFLCSTPELQKHYEQLVGCKEQVWSPKLETISEYKVRFSPCKFIGLEWKQKEK